MGDSDGILGGGIGIIILILFLVMLMGGNNLFGGGANNAVLQGIATRADVNDVITSQNIENAIVNTNNNMTQQFASLNLANMNNFAQIQAAIAALSAQQASCCCDVKSTVLSDGQLTRNMIQDQTIQDLRDKLSDKDQQILVAQLAASQVAQTSQLENYIEAKLAASTTPAAK